MQTVKKIIIALAVILGLNVILMATNILQNGIGGWDGRTAQEILGVPVDQATKEDILKLSKADVMQLFYASPAPEFSEMKGEYRAAIVPKGILGGPTAYYTNNFFGTGTWKGKAFFPFEESEGWGYNIFLADAGKETIKLDRTRKMKTFVGPSQIDDRDSFHLDYSPFNDGLVHSMRDEIRKVNDRLFIGMGSMALGGGPINPAPFLLYGEAAPWMGPDTK